MNPLMWRDRARALLYARGQGPCFVRFAREDEPALFITDAQSVQALEEDGFQVRESRGSVRFFDPPDGWYRELETDGQKRAGPNAGKTEEGARLWALERRLLCARAPERTFTDGGRALLRETARACFSPGGLRAETDRGLRRRAAILQRRKDTGAFATAAAIAAAARKMRDGAGA